MKLGEHSRSRYRNQVHGVSKESPPTTPAELAEREEAERLNRTLVFIPIGQADFEETAPGIDRSAAG